MSLIFVGAGGSGVSALVQLMLDLHIPDLVCVDATDSPSLERFREAWIATYVGHGKYVVTAEDLVIYSAATLNSSEVEQSYKHTLQNHLSPPPMLYAEFLWELSKYLYTFALSGTHGKSTTTGMSAAACINHIPETALAIVGAGVTARQGKHCRYNPAHGTELRNIVLRIISRKATALTIPLKKLLFVIEADEFNHHFLFLEPDVSIITSLDHDHVDIYPTRDSYLTAFNQFCTNTKEAIFTLPGIASELQPNKKIIIPPVESFDFTYIIGGHNHTNASLALGAVSYIAQHYNKPITSSCKTSIEQFLWLQRRVEFIGNNTHGVPVFSDYGHHPDEIKSTLSAFQEKYPAHQVTCFFEAHQARRLLTFRDEFVVAFGEVRCVVVPPYTAREDIATIQAYRKELTAYGGLPERIESFRDIVDAFTQQVKGEVIHDRADLGPSLQKVTQWAILCFSAWILDSKLRDCLT